MRSLHINEDYSIRFENFLQVSAQPPYKPSHRALVYTECLKLPSM